ncbi:MAG TPA: MBL fold metallo-hydrolase [bacterium]|nr:MBL fold metallo-hydrolase [bacterium]
MKIKWNGHSSFTITASDGTVIVMDPYEPGGFGGGIKYGPVDDEAHVALVSHDHGDHNFVSTLKGKPAVLKKSGSAGGIEFTGVEAAHDDKGGSERGKNVMFVFTVDGVRLAHVGDLGHLLTKEQAAALGKVDVLLVPVGGFFTIDAATASKVVEQVKPRVVIPMHYKTDKCGFPIAEVDEFAKLMTKVKKTGQTEIEITNDKLPPQGPEVWIMDHAR